MALSNAAKQKRWRTAHAERRRNVQRIATMLTRQSHAEQRRVQAKVGWNDVAFDGYFETLAGLLAQALETDREIRQLKQALANLLLQRCRARQMERQVLELWLREHPGMTSKDHRRLRDTEVAQWKVRKHEEWKAEREGRGLRR